VVSQDRHYRFGLLDSGSISLTGRAAYTFSPRLSLQAYAQLFLARGRFTSYFAAEKMGLAPRLRFSDLVADPAFRGDSDADGVKDDDFEDVALNLNLVLRWDYMPGAALLVVFTRAERGSVELRGAAPGFGLRGLPNGPTEDVFLVKLTYYLGS